MREITKQRITPQLSWLRPIWGGHAERARSPNGAFALNRDSSIVCPLE